MNTREAELELTVIKKIMEDSRKVNIDNGNHFLLWGIVVTFALLANYIMLLTKTAEPYIGMIWFILMISAAVVDWIMAKKEAKSRKVHTYAASIIGSLWFASGIAMFIFGFLGTITKAYNPVYICPIISTSLGVSYFTSGAIQQVKWLQNISFGWWAGAAVMFIFPSIHSVLIFAVMVTVLQIIPGIILNKKSKEILQIGKELSV